VWLGEADPVESMNQLRKKDPRLEEARSIMGQWREAFGSQRVTVAEVVRHATEMRQSFERAEPANPDFRDALMAVAGRGSTLSGKALGNWLSGQQDRIVDGLSSRTWEQGRAWWSGCSKTPMKTTKTAI
jgi:putative DNA primase/helicase